MSSDSALIQEIFLAVLEEKASSRSAALDARCRDNPQLREEVEALLQAHAVAGSVIDPIFSRI